MLACRPREVTSAREERGADRHARVSDSTRQGTRRGWPGESGAGAGRTLVIFPGALGDAVCLEPAVAALALHGPVTVCARGAAAEVAALFPSRPSVDSIDRREVAALFRPRGSPSPELDAWLARFSKVVSFTGAGVAAVEERLRRHRDARAFPFPSRDGAVHASDAFLAAVLGRPSARARPPRLEVALAARGTSGRARLALHPGAGSRRKRLDPSALLELASRWRDSGGELSVLLGPAEVEEVELWRRTGVAPEVPGDVAALAGALARCDAYLGHDSGPSHVAAALGLSAVVLFVSTSPASFGPRGDVCRIEIRRGPDAVRLAWEALARRIRHP